MTGWRRFAFDSVLTAAKSAEIATRGARVWNSALFACAWMSIDDAFAAHRTRLSCRSLGSLLRLERDLTPHAIAELATRSSVLGRIGIEIAQDAAYPLQQRAALALDQLFGAEPPSVAS